MDIDNRKRNTDRMNLTWVEITNRTCNDLKKKSRPTSETIDDSRSVSINLIYIHGPRVTSWLSILGSLGYRSHRWTSRGLIYWQTALPRLVSSLTVSSNYEFVLERLHYRHSIDDKVLIKLESYLYKVILSRLNISTYSRESSSVCWSTFIFTFDEHCEREKIFVGSEKIDVYS